MVIQGQIYTVQTYPPLLNCTQSNKSVLEILASNIVSRSLELWLTLVSRSQDYEYLWNVKQIFSDKGSRNQKLFLYDRLSSHHSFIDHNGDTFCHKLCTLVHAFAILVGVMHNSKGRRQQRGTPWIELGAGMGERVLDSSPGRRYNTGFQNQVLYLPQFALLRACPKLSAQPW